MWVCVAVHCMWVCVAVHCRKFMARSSTNQCSIIMCVTMVACSVTIDVTVPKQGKKFQNPKAEPLNWQLYTTNPNPKSLPDGLQEQISQLTILVCSEILRYLIQTQFGFSSTVTSSYYINKTQNMAWRKLIINNRQKKLRQKLCWIHGWNTDHRPF